MIKIRTKEEMYCDIMAWEHEAGEDFLDYFGSRLNEFNFMFWALGKGFITDEQLNSYERCYRSAGTEFLYGDEDYSVVKEDDFETYMDGFEYASKILAEFFASSITYQRRVDHFLKGIEQVTFEKALEAFRKFNDHVYYELNGKKVRLGHDTPLTAEIISKSQWFIKD